MGYGEGEGGCVCNGEGHKVFNDSLGKGGRLGRVAMGEGGHGLQCKDPGKGRTVVVKMGERVMDFNERICGRGG